MAIKKKRKKTKDYKVYLILCERTKHLFGAFPYTEEGLTQAKKYVKKISHKNKDSYLIKPS
tara:strand:+ start:147 stop:329 length:183 start_codon:yes stop_codon:yes gene_type:complete